MADLFNNELNYIMLIPLQLLGIICILFLILINNLSLLNVLIFVILYLILTRMYYQNTNIENNNQNN